MFSFFRNKTDAPASPAKPPAPAPAPKEPHPLDAVTGGIFSAENSAQRQERVARWLATNPEAELLQQVHKALSHSDKGAAKPIRQRMNDIRQDTQQEQVSQDWAAKAEKILSAPTFHIADGMAWQRDAAKAGAPLSRPPLSELRSRIAEQIKALEELQHKAMVQKEAAVLLAQRIDVLSTKPWQHASDAATTLAQDVQKWNDNAQQLTSAPLWSSVEPRHANAIDSSRQQLTLVFEAFSAALAQARAAAEDPAAPLPQVQVWADELRALHGLAAPAQAEVPAVTLSPEQQERITAALKALEQTVKQGQAKQSAQAAAALRESLKDLGGHVEAELERRINRALIDAGDLQGWQRWGANQVREELIARAEKLLDAPEGQTVTGSRALQTQVRELHEQWRQVDRSSPPNGHLWKRFDEAISKARVLVDEWLKKIKAEAQAHKSERQSLIDEARALAASLTQPVDLKALQRQLQQLGNRWRSAGHVNDKVFEQLRTQWKEAYDAAAAPLEQARKHSAELRRALIEEAKALAAKAPLDIPAIKALQQRWQAEAQSVPLERKLEQKLWDAFRQPIDQAFQRKDAQRSQAQAAASAHDQAVLDAAQALEAATAAGDAQAIRQAMDALQAAVRGVPAAAPAAPAAAEATPAPADAPLAADAAVEAAAENTATSAQAQAPAGEPTPAAEAAESPEAPEASASEGAVAEDAAPTEAASEVAHEAAGDAAAPAPAEAPTPAPKRVIAVRGDDRPGARLASPAPLAAGRDARAGDRRGPRGERGERGGREDRLGRGERAPAAPRLGDRAFRAQRNALESAQAALRKLSAQAHGESVTQLLDAWKARDAEAVPAQAQLGKRLSAQQWNGWKARIAQPAADAGAAQALLRLEIAAEVPTPADFISERRALQLQLLTQKHAATPDQTWVQDVETVLASAAEETSARRLQAALKALLKR